MGNRRSSAILTFILHPWGCCVLVETFFFPSTHLIFAMKPTTTVDCTSGKVNAALRTFLGSLFLKKILMRWIRLALDRSRARANMLIVGRKLFTERIFPVFVERKMSQPTSMGFSRTAWWVVIFQAFFPDHGCNIASIEPRCKRMMSFSSRVKSKS